MKINKTLVLPLLFTFILSPFFIHAKQIHFCSAPDEKIGSTETFCGDQMCVRIHYIDQNTCHVEHISGDFTSAPADYIPSSQEAGHITSAFTTICSKIEGNCYKDIEYYNKNIIIPQSKLTPFSEK